MIEGATGERGGRYCASAPPPPPNLGDLICTKDVRGRKTISITNTLAAARFPRDVSVSAREYVDI